MGLPKFLIQLGSPTGSYYAGTNVTGRVVFTLDKQKKFRGLKIKFEGKAHVAWDKRESHRKNDETVTESVTYSASEEYFSNKYYLVGSANSDIELPAGEHVYPFSTTLPPTLPSSFEGEHGYVRYTIVATLDRPWKMDYEAKTIFQVFTPLDLNYHALAKEPKKQEETKTFCCFCCESGPLTVVACLPFTGYVPGQDIPVTVEVDNASNTKVDNIKIKVLKVIKWTVRNPKYDTDTDNIDLCTLTLEGVDEGGSRSFTQNISIPQMPFVNVDACSIIDITFALEVTACVDAMCSEDLSARIPLIIGTVPIYNGSTGAFPGMQPAPSPVIMPTPGSNVSPQPPPIGIVPTPGSMGMGGGGGYGPPGYPVGGGGFNPAVGGIPMADGTSPSGMPYQPNTGGFSVQPGYPMQPGVPTPYSVAPGEPSAPGITPPSASAVPPPGQYPGANQPMYPQPVYPDLSIDKLPTSGLLGFNAVTPNAPPDESAPLMK